MLSLCYQQNATSGLLLRRTFQRSYQY